MSSKSTESLAPVIESVPGRSQITKNSTDRLRISVIVPTYNEEAHVGKLVSHLIINGGQVLHEVLVIDGGSQDQTVTQAKRAGASVYVSPQKGRAPQMNLGAQLAQGNMLYFVHADTRPPASYADDIQGCHNSHVEIGSYRSDFGMTHPLLRLNAYLTRFSWLGCQGGDQSLFVARSLFDQLGGYDPYYVVLEDFDFIRRAKRRRQFHVIQKDALVSARKYEDNSYWRVNLANLVVFTLFRMGVSPQRLLRTYKKMVRYPKY